MSRLKCPRCATVIDVPPGTTPMCPNCGFGSSASPAMAPPPAPAPAPVAAGGWAQTSPPTTGYMSPPGPPGWSNNPRPGWVTFAAVMQFIGAAFALLVGLIALVAGSIIAAIFEEGLGELGDVMAGIIAFVGIILIGLGVLAIFVGIGLLKGRGWARVTAIVFAIIGALFAVLNLIAGDFSALLSLVIDGLILFALFNPQSRAWFEQHAHVGHSHQ